MFKEDCNSVCPAVGRYLSCLECWGRRGHTCRVVLPYHGGGCIVGYSNNKSVGMVGGLGGSGNGEYRW